MKLTLGLLLVYCSLSKAALYEDCFAKTCNGTNEICTQPAPNPRFLVCGCKPGWRIPAGYYNPGPGQVCVVEACDSGSGRTACRHGGKCAKAVSGSFCDCVGGWWAQYCSYWNQGSQQLTTQLTGSVAVNYTEIETMACKVGWSGTFCDTAVNCGGSAPSFCSGHGTCENADATGNPYCVCNSGFTGSICQTVV